MKITYFAITGMLYCAVLAGCEPASKSVINENASVHPYDELPENPLTLKPITSSINVEKGTMSTLYGNKLAFSYAKGKPSDLFPAGAVLYEVTWKQTADPVWFGANIPKEVITVERVSFNHIGLPTYQLYSGRPLKKSASNDPTQRISFICSQRMAVSP